MSGITRSTPNNSDSGNIIPASTTRMSSPSRNAIMFIPNSPSPPSGITINDALLLLKSSFFLPFQLQAYHIALHTCPEPPPTQTSGGVFFSIPSVVFHHDPCFKLALFLLDTALSASCLFACPCCTSTDSSTSFCDRLLGRVIFLFTSQTSARRIRSRIAESARFET